MQTAGTRTGQAGRSGSARRITRISGRAVALMRDDIDTDQIIPKQFLKSIFKTGYGKNLFHDWRYGAGHRPNPDFELNKPERRGAKILIAGANFGCGSSREHAVWALRDYGFQCVIAGGFADIFATNAQKNRLLTVVLADRDRAALAALPARTTIEVDVEHQAVRAEGHAYPFAIEPATKKRFIEGLDDIALTLRYLDRIAAFERAMPDYGVREGAGRSAAPAPAWDYRDIADGILQEESA